MALPDLLINVGTALDRVENYISDVDTTINPNNTLNGIRVTLTTVRGHMQRSAQDAINLQGLLNIANRQINGQESQVLSSLSSSSPSLPSQSSISSSNTLSRSPLPS